MRGGSGWWREEKTRCNSFLSNKPRIVFEAVGGDSDSANSSSIEARGLRSAEQQRRMDAEEGEWGVVGSGVLAGCGQAVKASCRCKRRSCSQARSRGARGEGPARCQIAKCVHARGEGARRGRAKRRGSDGCVVLQKHMGPNVEKEERETDREREKRTARGSSSWDAVSLAA